jgi:hypothetical protein
MTQPADAKKAERCNECDQRLIEIDNRGERLVGCLTCNLWTATESKGWIRLGEDDLRALHHLRHRAVSISKTPMVISSRSSLRPYGGGAETS